MSIALGFLGLTSSGAALAAPLPTNSAPQIEALCAGPDDSALAFGVSEETVTEATRAQIGQRARLAGFEEGSPRFTSWSGRLFAVDFTRDIPSGDPLTAWSEEFADNLADAGWSVSDDASMPLAAARFEKEFASAEGLYRLAVELDINGERRGITLRCADVDLQIEDQNEREGLLEPGAKRPVAPPAAPPIGDFLARLDCDDPDLLELFARTEDLDDAGALVEARLGPPFDLHREANYQQRLVTWLRWRLVSSGRVDEEKLWAVEERVAQGEAIDQADEFIAFAEVFGAVLEAQRAKDHHALCKAYGGAIAVIARQSAAEASRDAALAAALEEEAVRLGIALD